MRLRIVSAASLLALTACSEPSPLSVAEVRTLAAARQRWDARSFPDYTYQVRSSCFCSEEHTQWREIEVRSGVITAIRVPGETASLPADRFAEWSTIEGLFERILLASNSDGLEDITVEYDQSLGFPETINFKAPDNVADGGAVVTARSVTPLP